MASTRAQQAQALKNATVLDQLAGSLLAAASQVLNEDPATADHENRLKFANAIILAPAQAAAAMVPALMTNATLQGQAGDPAGPSGTPFSDSDVDFVVAGVFNTYADQYIEQIVYGASLRLGS
jgi:hypothetical protein